MNDIDQARFKKSIAKISVIYGKKLDPVEVFAWWDLFKGYSIDDFEKALHQHILDPEAGMYKPTPAHLMKYLNSAADTQAQAELAWEQVYNAIGRLGPYRPLKLEDKRALATVKAVGGWTHLCNATYEQLVWIKKEFCTIYETHVGQDHAALPGSLPGLVELDQEKRTTTKTLNKILERI